VAQELLLHSPHRIVALHQRHVFVGRLRGQRINVVCFPAELLEARMIPATSAAAEELKSTECLWAGPSVSVRHCDSSNSLALMPVEAGCLLLFQANNQPGCGALRLRDVWPADVPNDRAAGTSVTKTGAPADRKAAARSVVHGSGCVVRGSKGSSSIAHGREDSLVTVLLVRRGGWTWEGIKRHRCNSPFPRELQRPIRRRHL